MKVKLDHKFNIGDMFHSHTTESIIVVTKLPDGDKPELYYGVYTGGANDEQVEKKIGYSFSIIQAINDGYWEYYPVKE